VNIQVPPEQYKEAMAIIEKYVPDNRLCGGIDGCSTGEIRLIVLSTTRKKIRAELNLAGIVIKED
jgi:hypothetical protein